MIAKNLINFLNFNEKLFKKSLKMRIAMKCLHTDLYGKVLLDY